VTPIESRQVWASPEGSTVREVEGKKKVERERAMKTEGTCGGARKTAPTPGANPRGGQDDQDVAQRTIGKN